jgi:N-acetylglutamate synthase-like GNAT family acetyltransferase
MYVRDAKNREEVWLLDHIETMELDETAFRSRDYVVAVDEDSGEKAGFGRVRVHKDDTGEKVCEMTSVGVLDGWRNQGVGAHVVERLVTKANDEEFDRVYALTEKVRYLTQFGFRVVDDSNLPGPLRDRLEEKRNGGDVVGLVLDVTRFRMPERLRERFKTAADQSNPVPEDDEDRPEDFGIDPDSATYKYDTG